jgi:hypothetical protein
VQAPPQSKARGLFALLAILASVATLGALAAPAAAAPVKLGVYVASQGEVGAPEDARVLDDWAAKVGRKPDIVMDYSNITDPLLTKGEIVNLAARGETPLVTWQLYKSGWGGPTIPLPDIAAGKYDGYLRQAADAAKSMPFGEILIRFAHEMNGNWYGWSGSPSAYVEAWRRVVTIFREQGASNVKFIWSPNVDYGDYPMQPYFPGDAWVDYVALDGYNWGATGQGSGRWESLSSVFESSYDQLTRLSSKPVMIAETSSSETGGSKADWIREGFLKTIPQQFPRVAAVIWFSRDQEDDWRVDSSPASLAAYREVVASTLYGGSVPPPVEEEEVSIDDLEVTPQVPPAPPPAPSVDPAIPVESAPTGPDGTKPPPLGKKRKRSRSAVRVRGKVVYRLSHRAAAVQLLVKGPGLRRGASEKVLTIYSPKRHGRVRLARLAGGKLLLRNRRYRVVARAVSGTGNLSKPRRARFRVKPQAHGPSRRGRR